MEINQSEEPEIQEPCFDQHVHFAIEAVPQGIVVITKDGQIVLANRQAEKNFGYDRDELLGQRVCFLIPERFRHHVPDFLTRFFANPASIPLGTGNELFGLRKDNSEFPAEIGFAPLRITEGLFALGEVVDVTVRKQLEAKNLRIKEIEVQESERCRLARELHDEFGQLLMTIGVELHAAKLTCGSSAPRLDDSIRLVHQAIEQVRDLSLNLRPPMLDELGLIATLRWYADRSAQRGGFVLHFVIDSYGASLPSDVITACYRVFQEALTNVVRHAQSRQVWVEFHENQEEVLLSIRDDGVGFNPNAVRQLSNGNAHFGVIGMKERVELLGGKIEIQSNPSRGTLIEVSIPLTTGDSSET